VDLVAGGRMSQELVERFDKRFQFVTGVEGRHIEFVIDSILQALVDAGTPPLMALDVIESIEHELHRGIAAESLDRCLKARLMVLDQAECAERLRLNASPARRIISSDGSEPVELTGESLARTIGDFFERGRCRVGPEGAGILIRNVSPDDLVRLSRAVLARCRASSSDVSEQAIMSELKERQMPLLLCGCDLLSFPAEIATLLREDRLDALRIVDAEIPALLEAAEILARAVVARFGWLPGFSRKGAFFSLGRLVEHAKRPAPHALNEKLEELRGSAKKSGLTAEAHLTTALLADDLEGCLQHLAAIARDCVSLEDQRLSDAPLEVDQAELQRCRQHLAGLASFARAIWPSDVDAIPTASEVARDVLSVLYGYRALHRKLLMRALQIKPGQVNSAVGHLMRQGYVHVFSLSDDDLVVLTEGGETYCEQVLGLSVRYSLPHV